jgi:hypothetical protein
LVFPRQVLVFSQPGALPAAALDRPHRPVRALDMDESTAPPKTTRLPARPEDP